MASQIVDHGGGRYSDPKGHNSIVGKKSMKFANNAGNLNGYNDDPSMTPGSANGRDVSGSGTIRANTAGTALHHHIGRHGRTGHHPTVLDQESLFAADRDGSGSSHYPNTGTSTPRSAHAGNGNSGLRSNASSRTRLSPFPHTPRTPAHLRIPGSAKSTGGLPYELEADDERTPLLPPSRSPRTRHSRRLANSHSGGFRGTSGPPSSPYYASSREYRRSWPRACGCALLGGAAALLVVAVVVALVFCSKPLLDVHIHDIRNVLAADRELVFDLNVHAVNPNLVAIQVSSVDLLVNARSKYVGTGKFWREHGSSGAYPARIGASPNRVNATDKVDDGTDPIDDPKTEDPHNMLLGQIREFDAPLLFEASPLLHLESTSVSGVRITRPGNQTEAGGSDRWETVIQHPFELIVVGVVKYRIPISSRVIKTKVNARRMVYPDDDADEEEGKVGRGAEGGGVGVGQGHSSDRVHINRPGRSLRLEFVA